LTSRCPLLSWMQEEAATTPPPHPTGRVVMKHISLGGLDVSRIGLGTMAMSGYYLDPTSSDAESIRTLQRALDLGVTHIDTAEIYGPYTNEELVGRALKGRRDDVVVATKFGFVSHAGGGPGVLDSSPANIRTAVEGSLKRLVPTASTSTTSTGSTRTRRSRTPSACSLSWWPRARSCT